MFSIFHWAWSILKSVLNTVAKTVVFLLLLVLVIGVTAFLHGDGLPGKMVLELDLRKAMDDQSTPSLLGIGNASLSVMDVVLGLDAAARDARVKGVFLRMGEADFPIAKAEELRAAILRFKQSGKFVIAHSQSFYSSGLGDYLTVSASDAIWMQPVSSFFAAGTATTTLFYKGLFDKLKAVPQFVQREEYKNAANVYTQTDYTPAHREATTRVLQSWYDSALGEIATDRKKTSTAIKATLDASPTMASDVQAAGLIDKIGYDDDARNAALATAGSGASTVKFSDFWTSKRGVSASGAGPAFALVHAVGDIVEGDGTGTDAINTSAQIDGDRFAQAIRAATRDASVKAIVVRIDSPGGSAIASDQILDALKKARAAGKPVVVSMGDYAASGGYYIALAANKIVAEPATLTGSIGVLWGKVSIGNSLGLAGLTAGEIGIGQNALFLSSIEPWTDQELKSVNAQADAVYRDFTAKVAAGRNMSQDKVLEVARGRVWTGADAKERGLVDELGSFWTAIDAAKKLTGIDAETRVTLKNYPATGGFWGALSRLSQSSEVTMRTMAGLNQLAQSAPIKTLAKALAAVPKEGATMRAVDLPQH
jgi:protease-4